MVNLVVTDLDGTLWGADFVISEDTKLAVKELKSRGIAVVAATARGAHTSKLHLSENDLELDLICYNGALGKTSDGATLFEMPFDRTVAAEVLRVFLDEGVVPAVALDQGGFVTVTGPDSSCTQEFLDYASWYMKTVDLEQLVSEFDCLQMFVNGFEHDALARIHSQLSESDVRLHLMKEEVYGPAGLFTLLVAPSVVSKWKGIEEYCSAVGLDAARVAVVGDGLNDLEMFERAHVSFAVAHAQPAVIDSADVVLDPFKGWSSLVDYLI